jgi:general secretion pathway protein D
MIIYMVVFIRQKTQRLGSFLIMAKHIIFKALVLSVWMHIPILHAVESGMNFQNADIRTVIEAVSKSTGKNFIIDPKVNGKVTLIASSEVGTDDLYDVFLSILKVHGYIAIPDENKNVIKILPASESKTESRLQGGATSSASNEVMMKIVQINNAAATDMIPILKPLVSKDGHLAAHQASNILIITDTRNNIDKLLKIIKKMDGDNGSTIKTIQLHNASAAEAASTLKELLLNNKTKNNSNVPLSIVAEEQTNSIMISGNGEEVTQVEMLLANIDIPSKEQNGATVVRLNYADATNIAAILNKMFAEKSTDKSKGDANIDGNMYVSVDEKANAVIIIGSPDKVENLRHVVSQLDVKRSQVMVEALIVEMTADKSKDLGIQWTAANEGLATGGFAANLQNSIGTTGTISGLIKTGTSLTFGALAQLLSTNANANLVSAPSIMTMENEEAEITVGREVPFITGSYTSTGNGSTPENPFTTISRDNVGLSLKITPQINRGNVIKLKIDQEFSNILPGAKSSIGAADVVTSKRTIKTNALVKDGQMLVLGGLIDDNVRETDTHIPGVAKLPLLGHLFKNRGTTKEKRNLMIFIRPKIITHENVGKQITEDSYNRIRNLQVQRHQQGVTLMPGQQQPVIENRYNAPDPLPRKTTSSNKAPDTFDDDVEDDILGF